MDIFTAFGLSASAGLNAYIPLLVVAFLARFTDLINLSSPWDSLTSWWVIGLLIFLSAIEFLADKLPVINHINDIIQSFVRPAAGAIVFAASTNSVEVTPILMMATGLFVAGSVHMMKSVAVRPTITATTAGTGNVPVSILEDVVATLFSILAIIIPVIIAALIILITATILWWLWHKKQRKYLVQ